MAKKGQKRERRPNSRGDDEPKCLVPDCERSQHRRGLCVSDWQYVMKLVKDEKVTFEQLERAHRILPKPVSDRERYFLSAKALVPDSPDVDDEAPPMSGFTAGKQRPTSPPPHQLGTRKTGLAGAVDLVGQGIPSAEIVRRLSVTRGDVATAVRIVRQDKPAHFILRCQCGETYDHPRDCERARA